MLNKLRYFVLIWTDGALRKFLINLGPFKAMSLPPRSKNILLAQKFGNLKAAREIKTFKFFLPGICLNNVFGRVMKNKRCRKIQKTNNVLKRNFFAIVSRR